MTHFRLHSFAALCASAFILFPAASAQASHHKHSFSLPALRRSLPSRGIVSRPVAPSSVVGRLGVVVTENAPIHAARGGRVLSIVPKGQNIAVNSEMPSEYAIVMIDHSLGYIAKKDVQLLDYQVVTNTPSTSAAPSETGETTSAPSGPLGLHMVETAQTYLGVPYVWGGNTRNGIDCSGFVRAIYHTNGIELPRVSGEQAAVGYDVPRTDWHTWVPGDRMYFACHHPRIDHTGMYIGNGYFIHASVGHNHQVAIDRVDNAYYWNHLVGVRRSRELLADAGLTGRAVPQASLAFQDTPQESTFASSDSEIGQQ